MATAAPCVFKQPSVLPGFGLALGFTLSYLCLIVLIPLGGARPERRRALGLGRDLLAHRHRRRAPLAALRAELRRRRSSPRFVNAVFGLIVAWVLVRYRFPGRRLLDAIVDLPFALPTAVAGIALTALYAPNGWIGASRAARASRSPIRRSASSWR